MRYREFASLMEAKVAKSKLPSAPTLAKPKAAKPMVSKPASKSLSKEPTIITKQDVERVLRQAGYEEFKIAGNKINVLVQIPDGRKNAEFRSAILQEILGVLKKKLPQAGANYTSDPGVSSLGGIIFKDSPVIVVVKDSGKQGDKSAGIANELEIASLLQSVVEKYGSANVTFIDERGKKLSIKNCTGIDVAGRDTSERKKADIVLTSKSKSLPISIKKLNADQWESADTMFGSRARAILDKLIAAKVVKLKKIGSRKLKVGTVPVYQLSKEIVMQPTQEEAMQAIFGSDINPEGGVVIQTFKPEHFSQEKNKVTIQAHAVIANIEDIPESHVMVWILRNDSTRNSATLGLAGIRPLGVTLTRGIGKSGQKDVVLVNTKGKVVSKF